MCARHVRRIRRVSTSHMTTRVRGDATAAEENFDGLRSDADVDLFATELIGHAVVVSEDLDVIVDVHARFLPLRILIGDRRESTECRPVERFKERAPASLQVLKRPIVEQLEQSTDLPVQLAQAEEGVLAQAGQDPAFYEQHAGFDLRFGNIAGLHVVGLSRREFSPSHILSIP